MVDLTRYRPILVVLAGLFAALAACNFLLLELLGRSPIWSRETFDGWYARNEVGGRVAAVLAENDAGRRRLPLRFGVVLGQSTANADFDPEILASESGLPLKWLMVYGFGGSFLKLSRISEPLWDSGLKPEIVLLVIDPLFLAGDPSVYYYPANHRVVDFGKMIGANGDEPIWLFANQAFVNLDIRMAFEDMRNRLMKSVHQATDVNYAPTPAPWKWFRDWMVPGISPPPDAWRQMELEHFSRVGQFDAKSYHAAGEQADALLSIIRQCRRADAKVVAIIMPESPVLRARMPRQGEECLEEVLHRAEALGPIAVLNMRDSQPDSHFYDLLHLTEEGRQSNSIEVARLLKRLFAEGKNSSSRHERSHNGSDHPAGIGRTALLTTHHHYATLVDGAN